MAQWWRLSAHPSPERKTCQKCETCTAWSEIIMTVYVASSFPKRKNTSDGQVFVQRCLKKTPIQSISVGHLFWSETKKICLPFSLLDTSFQLGWRVCVVLSCLFSWGIREGSQQKMAFCLQVTLTLGQRTWIIENGTLPLLNGAHLIWQIVKILL